MGLLLGRRLGVAAAVSTAVGSAWFWKPATPSGPPRALKAGEPLVCALQSKRWVSSDVVRLRFVLPSSEQVLGLPVPGHLMVVDDAMTYRPYSPISIDSQAVGYFELLVRRYPRGEFSTQLARMEPGDSAHFRGPVGSRFTYSRGAARHIGLVAAGTGITPMWQVIQSVLESPDSDEKLSLL